MKMLYKIALFFVLFVFAGSIFAQENENGIELYNAGEYQKAAEILQKAVESDEEDKKSWLYLGMSLAKLEKDKKARAAFQKAYKLPNPKKKEGANQTGIIIVSKPLAKYTDAARKNQQEGTVRLAVEFGADGIKTIYPFEKLPYGLTENCIEAVKEIRYKPATEDGKPISAIMIISYSFVIY